MIFILLTFHCQCVQLIDADHRKMPITTELSFAEWVRTEQMRNQVFQTGKTYKQMVLGRQKPDHTGLCVDHNDKLIPGPAEHRGWRGTLRTYSLAVLMVRAVVPALSTEGKKEGREEKGERNNYTQ